MNGNPIVQEMKAAIYDAPEKLRLTEKNIPEINKHEILVKQQAAGISTSDIQAYKKN
jgi:D-arabinose 1-dehydrogenase-like Zn-dependent alcohol dehydrogenase